MTIFQSIRDSLPAVRRALVKPALLSIFLGGLAVAANTASTAHGHGHGHDIVAHVQTMLQFVYDNTGATDAQKTRIAALAQQASADLAPVQEKMNGSHAQMFSLLTADNIDRGAIEAARAAHMNAADQESRLAVQFVADVAETLTPAQRKALAEHVSHH